MDFSFLESIYWRTKSIFKRNKGAENTRNLFSKIPLILCIFCAFVASKNQRKITMKKALIFVFVLVFASAVFAQNAPNPAPNSVRATDLTQYGVRIAPDKRLIVMMAALEVAGVDNNLGESGNAFRQKLRADLGTVNPELVQKMQNFIASYKSRHSNLSSEALTAPFVSLAYAIGQAPDFTEPLRSADLPDDLLEVLDFTPLVREFYRTTNFEAKMPEYLKLYQEEGDKLRPSTILMVETLLDYLKTKPQLYTYDRVKTEVADPKNKNKKVEGYKTVEKERKFFIVPDLLAPVGTVNFRNIGDEYYLVVPPNTNLRFSEARRGYLQYVLDPLILKNAKDIAGFREGIKSLLDERRKFDENISPDVFIAVSRSLVAAIDAREKESYSVQIATDKARGEIELARGVEAKKAVSAKLESDKKALADETALELSRAYERGAVLAFYFANQLKGVENSGFDIASALNTMVAGMNPAGEQRRLAEFADARQRATTAREERRKLAEKSAVVDSEKNRRLLEIKKKLEAVEALTQAEITKKEGARNFEEVEKQLKKLLEEYPNEASVYYALGRIYSLSAREAFDEGLRDRRLEDAKLHYGNAIRQATTDTDPALVQLSYVAVGRIFEFEEDFNAAVQSYKQALRFGNANVGAYNEASLAIARINASAKP